MLFIRHLLKRIIDWQYWPAYIFYLPPVIYYFFLAIRARSIFFFHGINPNWYNSGLKGDSKWVLQQNFCIAVMPKSILLQPTSQPALYDEVGLPAVIKPDVGQRGKGVQVINSQAEIKEYLAKSKGYSILQQYSDLPQEWGVFYVRYPNQHIGKITSLMQRSFWTVIGDGQKNLWELATASDDWLPQYKRMEKFETSWRKIVPLKNEKYVLEPIGNHNRGTAFLDRRELINPRLVHRVEQLIQALPDFHFGRIDLKLNSLDDFQYGGEAHIIEINGFGAEPAHIYQKGYTLKDAWCDVFYHIKLAFLIAQENKALGISYPSFRKGVKMFLEKENPLITTKHFSK